MPVLWLNFQQIQHIIQHINLVFLLVDLDMSFSVVNYFLNLQSHWWFKTLPVLNFFNFSNIEFFFYKCGCFILRFFDILVFLLLTTSERKSTYINRDVLLLLTNSLLVKLRLHVSRNQEILSNYQIAKNNNQETSFINAKKNWTGRTID